MPPINSSLVSRNVTISGHRTSIRLEAHMWEAFDEICQRENMSVHELCTLIDNSHANSSRTAAVRAYAVNYYRQAATEEGHRKAGHGTVADNNNVAGEATQRSMSA